MKSALRPVPYSQASLFVLDTPRRYGKSSNGWQLTSATGVSPQLWFSQSRPHWLRRFYHAQPVTGREYHYPHCLLWPNRWQPGIYRRRFLAYLARSGVMAQPLTWLPFTTVAMGTCLMNGFLVFKVVLFTASLTENR